MAPTTEMIKRGGNEIGCLNGACGKMESSEKYYIAGGAGVCGAIVLSVGAILLYKRIKTRSRAKAEEASEDMSQPMISSFNQSRFSFHSPATPSQAYQPPTRPPISPAMSSVSSYHDSNGSGSSSSSGHSHSSPMSDQGSAFHFPLLSADGHLMPPVPASSRAQIQTWNISEGDLGAGGVRPLPNAPDVYDQEGYEEYQYQYQNQYSPNPSYEHAHAQDHDHEQEDQGAYDEKSTLSYYHQPHPVEEEEVRVNLVAPTPVTPKRWSYEPPHTTPSPDHSLSQSHSEHNEEVIGLYPSIEFRGDGSIDYGYGQRRGMVDDQASIRSSPRVAQVQDNFGGFHQPQSATYHRSFSAEGEEIMAP